MKFAKKHFYNTETTWNKIFCSDETKVELLVLNLYCQILENEEFKPMKIIPSLKYGGTNVINGMVLLFIVLDDFTSPKEE